MVWHRGLSLALFALGLMSVGCSNSDPPKNPDDVKPEHTYKGLEGQTCAVMVYADWRTRVDYNRIQGDLAQFVQQRIETLVKGDGEEKQDKKNAATQTRFLNPLSVVRYQREHPQIEGEPITEVAPRLGVSRLIYIELTQFSAQSPESIMILKGTALASLRVLEISGGKATVAFEESGILTRYPPDAPEGVVPSDKYTVPKIYKGTLERLADKIALRFAE